MGSGDWEMGSVLSDFGQIARPDLNGKVSLESTLEGARMHVPRLLARKASQSAVVIIL